MDCTHGAVRWVTEKHCEHLRIKDARLCTSLQSLYSSNMGHTLMMQYACIHVSYSTPNFIPQYNANTGAALCDNVGLVSLIIRGS